MTAVDVATGVLEYAAARCNLRQKVPDSQTREVAGSRLTDAAESAGCEPPRFPRFELLDVLRYPQQTLSLLSEVKPSLLFVDLGGNRRGRAIAPLLAALDLAEVPAVLTVVKCRDLHARARNGERWQELLERVSAEDGDIADDAAAAAAAAADTTTTTTPVESRASTSALDPLLDQNLNASSGETRLCYTYLNCGHCQRADCAFRHLLPEHPEAIADRAKRAALGWRPLRVQAKLEPALDRMREEARGQGEGGDQGVIRG